MKSYFNEEGQSVLFEGKEAEDMVLSTLGKRNQVSKAVSIYRFSLQQLCIEVRDSFMTHKIVSEFFENLVFFLTRTVFVRISWNAILSFLSSLLKSHFNEKLICFLCIVMVFFI